MSSIKENAKAEALAQFKQRIISARRAKRVNNADLPAESPMFFYCLACDILIEELPENYLFPPYKFCSQCQGMKQEGWFDTDANKGVKT